MSAPEARAGIYRLLNFNFTTFISNSASSSLVPFQKCCAKDQFYSVEERKCVSDDTANLPNSLSHPDPSKFDIHYGFPCLYPRYKYLETNFSKILDIFQEGSADVLLNNEDTLYRLEWKQYCVDADRGASKFTPVLITCDQVLQSFPVPLVYFIVPYLVSLLLVIITFSLYLAMPKLRTKVKDKCFICYLASLIFYMIVYADVLEINGVGLLDKLFSKEVAVSLMWYSFMETFSWLNVMCIHLWRVVTTVNSISPRSFYFYTLYALGFPLIFRILFEVDCWISGIRKFSYRIVTGGIFSNPIFLYSVDVCAVQHIMNVCIFIRVGYVIWNQKQRWNGNANCVKNKRFCRQKTTFSQLLRLFIIMGLDWTYMFIVLYYEHIRRAQSAFLDFCFWVDLCPGYFIFIIYICCDKKVVYILRRRFSKTKNMSRCKGSTITSPLASQDNTPMSSNSLTQSQ